MLLALAVAFTALPWGSARADQFYKWVDESGVFHITDRLSQVPEPYRSVYAAQARERKKREEEAAKARGEAPASSSASKPKPKVAPPRRPGASTQGGRTTGGLLAREEAQRQKWQGLVQQWREALLRATREIEAIDAQIQEATRNPVLRYTAPVLAELQELERQRNRAEARLAEARRMLLEELPERARKEQVPHKWLE